MKPITTTLSKRLGLTYPLVAAPMFIISNKEMIVACAEAGIMGTMPSINARTPEAFREDLAWIRQRTDKAFGINFTLGMLKPERLAQDFQACVEFEVPVLITSYGNPTELAKRAHEHGMTVFHDVINLRHAQKAQSAGVDAVIGVASGAGGHAGQTSPFVLLPHLRQHLDVPLIAAGAITTGQQVAAALSLGAELCYMGTRFITSKECAAQAAYKQMVVDAQPEDILYTDRVSGTHANFLKATVPETMDEDDSARRWVEIWSAGQGSALINDVQTIEQIVQEVVGEFHDTLSALGRLV